jgi:Mn2+/Fe2+ NRAMP family transporter
MGGFVPQVPEGSLDSMIGLIGAVIMPHNLFLHSSLGEYFNPENLRF